MQANGPRAPTSLQRDGYELVRIDKRVQEIDVEAQALAKLRDLPEYARGEIGDAFVATPLGRPLALDSVGALVLAMQALRRVHLCGVVHADLKEDHVLVQVDTDQIFFVDFAYAVFEPSSKSPGLSCFYASLGNLTRRTVGPLDDYEALLMAALSWLDDANFKSGGRRVCFFPPHPDGRDGMGLWVRWKHKFQNFVMLKLRAEASAAAKPGAQAGADEAARLLSACYRGLAFIWDFQSRESWLSDQEHEAILSVLQV